MKTVTAAIIRNADGKILICRRAMGQKNGGLWEFPGGKQEQGESLAECLERELFEELGIRSRAGEILEESVYHYEHGAIKLVGLFTEWLDGHMQPTVHDELAWVLPKELVCYPLSPADLPIAKKLMSP